MSGPTTEKQSPTVTRVGLSSFGSAVVTDGGKASPDELTALDFLPPSIWPKLQATLAELCLCLTEAVPSSELTGVVIISPESLRHGHVLERAEVIGAAPVGNAVLQMERQLDEGPILTAYGIQSIVSSGELQTDRRWHRFGPAVGELQFQSVVAVPLRGMSSDTSGVLTLYSRERNAFDAHTIHLIAAMADVVRNALVAAEMLERTRRAFKAIREDWDRSRVVNQAVGVLISRNCTEEQARSRLARMAGRRNEDIAASARIIVDEARREAHLSSIATAHLARRAE